MSNINAAIGISQMYKLAEFKKKRQKLCSKYEYNFKLTERAGVRLLTRSSTHVPHIFPILLDKRVNRELLRHELLHTYNIQTGIHYYPNHLLNLYSDNSSLPAAEEFGNTELTLPLHTGLSLKDIDYIVEAVLKLVEEQLR